MGLPRSLRELAMTCLRANTHRQAKVGENMLAMTSFLSLRGMKSRGSLIFCVFKPSPNDRERAG
ncbi:MAG: hypothetical protein DDT41_01348 [candidate division WS2 bacterium]|nr:hypothetical protein [Candidatus Psychracetigena formicireducens]